MALSHSPRRPRPRPTRVLVWWRKSHWSALIGLGLLIVAMVVGDVLGIARLF